MSDSRDRIILAAIEAMGIGLRAEMAALRAEVTADFTALRADLTALRTDFTTMRTDLAALSADLTALRGEMVTRSELATLRRDLMERMDRFENKLTDTRDDITVNMGAVDQARDMSDSTRNERRALTEQVSVMYRQIKRLETRVNEITGDPPGEA